MPAATVAAAAVAADSSHLFFSNFFTSIPEGRTFVFQSVDERRDDPFNPHT